MKSLFDGKMEYDSQEELEKFINDMSPQEAGDLLEIGLHHSTMRGAFDLEEAAVLYAALRRMQKAVK